MKCGNQKSQEPPVKQQKLVVLNVVEMEETALQNIRYLACLEKGFLSHSTSGLEICLAQLYHFHVLATLEAFPIVNHEQHHA